MKHIIEGQEVDIDWEQVEIIDNHGSGCIDWMVKGTGDDGKEYYGDGNYQSGELIEVTEIEELEK